MHLIRQYRDGMGHTLRQSSKRCLMPIWAERRPAHWLTGASAGGWTASTLDRLRSGAQVEVREGGVRRMD